MHAMNTNPPNSQDCNNPSHAIADFIDDIHELPGKLDSFARSFTLAWTQNHDHQRQHSPITHPEKTSL
jgi:hypothetical protein